MRAVPEEAQPAQRDLGRELAGNHAAFDEHRDGCQGEADGGDAAGCAGLGLVTNQTVGRVGLMKVVMDRRRLQPIQILVGQQLVQILSVVRQVKTPSDRIRGGSRRPCFSARS
jgi:hypothetical protein